MLIAFIACPFLIWAAWDDLSNKGALGFLVVSAALVVGFFASADIPGRGGWFIAGQCVVDIMLALIAFGGDFRMTP